MITARRLSNSSVCQCFRNTYDIDTDTTSKIARSTVVAPQHSFQYFPQTQAYIDAATPVNCRNVYEQHQLVHYLVLANLPAKQSEFVKNIGTACWSGGYFRGHRINNALIPARITSFNLRRNILEYFADRCSTYSVHSRYRNMEH